MDRSETNRSAWVLPSLSWSAVTKARARLKSQVAQAPSHIGDIDPRVLVELMPYFRMMRWEDDGRLIFRLYGSALVEATGFDLTGYPCIAPEDYEGKADDIARLKLLHAHPCGLLMHRDLHRTDGTTYTCEFMTLPVAGGDDGRNRIVGTVLPCVEVDEHRLDFTLSVPLTLRRAVFLDIGYGLPDEAAELSL
jgi:hypothetical protein